MIKSCFRLQRLRPLIAFFVLIMAASVEAGLFDKIEEQARKAQEAVDSLNRALGGAGQAPSREDESRQDSRNTQSNPGAEPVTNPYPSARPPVPQYDRNQVATIQRQLNALGYQVGTADGLYGPGTRRGIEAFQRDQGLPVDGKPSSTLQARLQAEIQSSGTNAPRTAAQTESAPVPAGGGQQFNAQVSGGLVKPIRPATINGRPVVGDSVTLSGEGKRLLAMAVINTDPKLLEPPAGWQADARTCLGSQINYSCMLAHLVEENFDKEIRQRYLLRTSSALSWRALDEFQLRKDREAVVTDLVPQLKKAAANYGFPMEVVVMSSALLGKYDFQKQTFPFSHNFLWDDATNYRFPVIAGYTKLFFVEQFDKPTEIKISPDRAEALRKSVGIFGNLQVLYALKLQGLKKGGIRAEVTGIELYLPKDKRYTSPFYTFDSSSFNRTRDDVARDWENGWEESLNWRTSKGGIPDARYLLSAHSRFYGEGEKSINTVLDSYANEAIRSGTPFEIQRKKAAFTEEFNRDEIPGLKKMLTSFEPGESIYLAGRMNLEGYDFNTESFVVKGIDVAGVMKSWYQTNQNELMKKYPFYLQALPYLIEQPKSLQIEPAVAEALYNKSFVSPPNNLLLPVRIKAVAKPVKRPASAQVKPHQYLGVQYVVKEIEILDIAAELIAARRTRYKDIAEKVSQFDPSWVLWRYVEKEPVRETAVAARNDVPRIELADTRYLLVARAALMRNDPLVPSVSYALDLDLKNRQFSNDPFENADLKDKEMQALTQRVSSFDENKPVWLAGKANFYGYDFDRQEFDLLLDVHGAHAEGYPRARSGQEIKPFVLFFRLPSTKSDAKQLVEKYFGGNTRGSLDVRVQAVPFSTGNDMALQSELLNGGGRSWSGQGHLYVVFQAKKIVFLQPGNPSSQQDESVLDPKSVILNYAPPGPWESVKR